MLNVPSTAESGEGGGAAHSEAGIKGHRRKTSVQVSNATQNADENGKVMEELESLEIKKGVFRITSAYRARHGPKGIRKSTRQ